MASRNLCDFLKGSLAPQAWDKRRPIYAFSQSLGFSGERGLQGSVIVKVHGIYIS